MNWELNQELAVFELGEMNRSHFKAYADASLDQNPIHQDDEFAKRMGLPSVIGHGMLSMGFLGGYVHRHFPEDQYRLVRFKSRFRKMTLPGDKLTCGAKVKKLLPDGKILLSVWIKNQKGETTTDGEAELTINQS